MKNSTLFAAVIAASLFTNAYAQTSVNFSYSTTEETKKFGTSKAETYNVAIDLTDAAFVGTTVTAIEVPVPVVGTYTQMVEGEEVQVPCGSGLSIWLTTQLATESTDAGKVNVANIATYPMEIPVEGEEGQDYKWVTFTLDEPYTITSEGLYVGYTFTIDKVTDSLKKPLVVTEPAAVGGFYLFTSRTYKSWNDRSNSADGVSPMVVTLSGNFPANGALVDKIPYQYYKVGEELSLPVKITNVGTSAITKVGYKVSAAGKTKEGEYTFATPIAANFTATGEAMVEVPAIDEAGSVEVTVEITTVNGEANGVAATSTATVPFVAIVPQHLSLVEEYTGTWCGWCPRGYVAMELMAEWYPEFTGVAYHNGDPMEMKGGDPGMVSGYPSSVINRTLETDPYYGNSNNSFGMASLWEECNAEFTPVAIGLEAQLDGETGIVDVTSTLNWVAVPEDAETANYRLEYILVADGLTGTGSTWDQANYYANGNAGYPQYMDQFTSGSSKVSGLIFNDVAIMTSGLKGIEGSIPSISTDEATEHSYQFDTNNALNKQNALIPFQNDKLEVLAMVIYGSKYGKVLNSVKVPVKVVETYISSVAADENGVVNYYDLQGRMISNPKGLCIRVTTDATGKVSSEKVWIR